MPNFNDILSDPEWLPHDYDPSGDRVHFIRLPISQREKLTFLADAAIEDCAETSWVSAEQLHHAKFESVPVHFIFHSAFCRSTLLVRAFGALPQIHGLSEPRIINALASSWANEKARSLLPVILRLLARPFGGEQAAIIKPSNVANALISAMLDCDARSRGIIIYGKLGGFLHSVARKGLQGRIWGRRLMAHNSRHIPLNLGLDNSAQFELSDMQAAAIAWLLHQWQFRLLISRYQARLFSLDSDQLTARKLETLEQGARRLGIGFARAELEELVSGGLFTTHAKLGGDFTSTLADQESRAASAIVDEEIDQVGQWIGVIQSQLDFSIPHGNALL